MYDVELSKLSYQHLQVIFTLAIITVNLANQRERERGDNQTLFVDTAIDR